MLEHILNSKPKARILKFLFDRPDWIFIESEIAKELLIPKATAHRTLKALLEQNVVREIKKKGKVSIYQLNKKNYIVKDLFEPLFDREKTIIIEKSKQFCRKIKKLKVGIVFGSASRGEMTPTSDIDLALVAEKIDKEEVEKVQSEFLDKEGIIFSVHFFDKRDFKKRYKLKDPHIIDIANGKVVFGNIDEVI